jgi:DNA-binding IclR family transcriptional regulator
VDQKLGLPLNSLKALLVTLAKLGYIEEEKIEVYRAILWAQTHGLTSLLIDKQIIVRDNAELESLIGMSLDIEIQGIKHRP